MSTTTALGRFVQGLAPSIDDALVMRRLNDIFDDMQKNLSPMVSISLNLDDTVVGKRLSGALRSASGTNKYKGDIVRFLRDIVTGRLKEKDVLIQLFETRFKQDILKDALEYDSATLLHTLSCLQWWIDFVRRAMSAMVRERIDDPYKPIEKKYLAYCQDPANLQTFALITSVLVNTWKEFSVTIQGLKNISFNAEQEDLMEKMYGRTKTDPLRLGYVPLISDVALLIGYTYNQWVKYWYDYNKEEKARLELEVLLLERKAAGATPEELEQIKKQIAYYTQRITELDAKIEDVENDATGYGRA